MRAAFTGAPHMPFYVVYPVLMGWLQQSAPSAYTTSAAAFFANHAAQADVRGLDASLDAERGCPGVPLQHAVRNESDLAMMVRVAFTSWSRSSCYASRGGRALRPGRCRRR